MNPHSANNSLINLPAWLLICLLHAGIFFIIQPDIFLNPFSASVKTGDGIFNLWLTSRNFLWFDAGSHDFFDGRFFYPASSTMAFSETLLFPSLVGYPLYLITQNSVFAYNILRILAFVASGGLMALFIRLLTRSLGVGIIASLYWNLSSFRLDHLVHFQNEWVLFFPLFFLCVTIYKKSPSFKMAFCIVLCWIAQFLSCGYFGMFLFLGFVAYILLDVMGGNRHWFKLNAVLPLALWAVAAAFVLYPYYVEYRTGLSAENFSRNLDEIKLYSAKWHSFLAAFPGQYLWGNITRKLYSHEKALFIGLLPMAGLIVFVLVRKKLPDVSLKKQGLIYLGMALFSALCCLGPIISLGGWIEVEGPYQILYRYVPGFQNLRVPARMGVLYVFSSLVVASAILGYFLNQYSGHRKLMLLFIGVLCLAETLPHPRRLSKIKDNPVEWNDWERVLMHDENAPVLHVPIEDDPKNAHRGADVMLWHLPLKNPVINGYSGYFPEEYMTMASDLRQDLFGAGLLYIKALGVKYLIFDLLKIKSHILEDYMQFIHENDSDYSVLFTSEKVMVIGLNYVDHSDDVRLQYLDQWIAEKNSPLAFRTKLEILKDLSGYQDEYTETKILLDALRTHDFSEKAKLSYWEKDYKKSLMLCNTALKMDPDFFLALLYKGLSLYKLNRFSEAREVLHKVLIKDPKNTFARDVLSKIKE